jgi:hypothetical protein
MTIAGENKKTLVYYFNASNLELNDIQFESIENSSPVERKETLLKLYEAGLLTDEKGELSQENKHRILEAFGFGGYENARDISSLHIAKAQEENLALKAGEVEVDSYDEHDLHISEHVRYLLSSEFKKAADKKKVKKFFEAHIAAHENRKKEK